MGKDQDCKFRVIQFCHPLHFEVEVMGQGFDAPGADIKPQDSTPIK